jgi:hypothetical protein
VSTQLDHLVIGAATLERGVAYVKHTLGVDIPYGGEHKTLGTHNQLMQLGPELFLEVIAINPAGEAINRPRWYGLDDPYIAEQLRIEPRLIAWVVNTDNLGQSLQSANQSFGRSTPISRGNLNWLFGLPEDGRLLAGGMLPYIMQWQTDEHPASKMANCGCALEQLAIYHPQADWLRTALVSINADHIVSVHAIAVDKSPYLTATLKTPLGSVTISSLN